MTTRVLVCDDVRDVRFLLRMSLGRDDALEVVGEARNGQEAIEQARELQPDLIVLDVSMPDVDGLEALPQLREVAPSSKVVVLTGLDRNDVESAAFRAGAVDFIEKGAHVDEIVRRIKRVVTSDVPTSDVPSQRNGELRQLPVDPTDGRPALVPRRSLPATLQIVPDAAFALAENGTVVAANDRALAMFGYRYDEVIGRSVEKLLPASARAEHKRLRAQYQEQPVERPMGTRAAMRARRADGTEFPVDISLTPIECEDGRLVVAALRDLTDRIRANRMQARLAAIVESSDDAIFSLDTAGRITSWNHGAEHLYGHAAEDVLGRQTTFLVSPELIPDDRLLIRRVLSGETVLRHETEGVTKDGRRLSVWLSASPLLDEAGAVVGVSVIARDVTDQRRAAKVLEEAYIRELEQSRQLRQVDTLKSAFLRALSHDLRNPLAVVVGMAELVLERDARMAPRDRQALELIVASGQRLGRVMSDLLDADRLSRGSLEAMREETDVALVVRRAARNLQLELAEHPITLDAPPHLVVVVDPTQTERLVENLLANAARHTAPDTPILLSLREMDGGVLISVQDEGPGVPDARKETIFELFATLDGARPGTGIGLHLVRQFAQLHAGRAWVEDGPSGGSCFRVFLPDAS